MTTNGTLERIGRIVGSGVGATASAERLRVRVDSGDALDVRRFSVVEAMNRLFEVKLTVVSRNADIEFDAVLAKPAAFELFGDVTSLVGTRAWSGLCAHIEQTAVETTGLSTYEVTIVPTLWLATQRRNHRMFQQVSELEIARQLLAEWGIDPILRISQTYKTRKYRVQYAESDYAFFSRMLEDAGVSFFFQQEGDETRLVLSDAPQASDKREPPIAFRDNPTGADREHVTKVRVGQQVRPGRYTLQDHDTRLPATYTLVASASAPDGGVESRLERYHYTPGAFLFGTSEGPSTPTADDRGKTRSDQREGHSLAEKRLGAKRANAKVCSFETNAADVAPGVVVTFLDHPRSELAADSPLLVVASSHEGDLHGTWTHRCEARPATAPFYPPLLTPKPKVSGVECATVVGASGDEIHTDEFGRVRVHFHWDRESTMNEKSSCWIPVSQSWGGAGYGGSNLPRVGQEVLVDFLGGDPDRPVVIGRIYTNAQKTPYKLPDNKTQSGWKSCSTHQTGGYNEIMFEDASGRELLRMQAEKDLHKLVKHDEDVVVGRNRTKRVKHDDALTVNNDRQKHVDRDESVVIGRDRTKLVKNNDDLTVAGNKSKLVQKSEREVVAISRTRMVGVNEAVTVGVAQNVSIGKTHSLKVGKTQHVKVGKSQDVKVGKSQTVTVGKMATETVGMVKALTVGMAYQVTVGAVMNTTVGMNQSEQIGKNKSSKVGGEFSSTVAEKYELVVGKSKFIMEKAGKITLATDEGATIVLDGKNIVVNAGGGGNVVIQGGPNVHINP